jgi:hypothetical protein
MRKKSTILMRAKDKKRLQEERDAEIQRAVDRDYREGRREGFRISPLFDNEE